MGKLLADRIKSITPFYVMELLRRAKELEQQGVNIIHMEIGEPDFPTPPAVIDAGIACISSGDVKYTPAAGAVELRETIAAFYHARYGVNVDKNRIFVTPGASGAFLLAFGVSLSAGDEILMSDPCYPCNSNFVALFDGNAKTVPVNADQHYQLSAAVIEQNWSASTKGVLIASPSNPTGTIISKEELQQSVKTVERLGGCFYSDEIYHGLVYDGQAETALAYSDDVFVINSFSKYFCMTGWRIGWLIVPERYVEATERLAQTIFISTPSHSQYAAVAAFKPENMAELERRRIEFAARRDFLYDGLKRLGFFIPVKPEGAFYIYADCSSFTNDSYQFAWDLLEQEGVAITPGIDFGSHNANQSVRFAYTTSIENIAVAMQRLEKFIKHYVR